MCCRTMAQVRQLNWSELQFCFSTIRLVGLEAYGLIGFYAMIQAALVLFDFGIGTTLNRDIPPFLLAYGVPERARKSLRT